MEIKRNIFESSVRMPGHYEPMAVPMCREDTNSAYQSVNTGTNSSVRHAPCPRVGEQK